MTRCCLHLSTHLLRRVGLLYIHVFQWLLDARGTQTRLKQHIGGTEPACKQVHKGQGDGLPDDRTLFVAGLPVVLANENLAQLLSRYGAVERAAVHPNQVRRAPLRDGG